MMKGPIRHHSVSNKLDFWSEQLHQVEYYYNTTFHSSLKTTPFNVVYDCDLPTIIHYGISSSPLFVVDQQLQDRDQMLNHINDYLRQAQAIMKGKVVKHKRNIQFIQGGLIYLCLHPFTMKLLAKKFDASWHHVMLNLLKSFIMQGHQLINCTYQCNLTFISCYVCVPYITPMQSLPLNLTQEIEQRHAKVMSNNSTNKCRTIDSNQMGRLARF